MKQKCKDLKQKIADIEAQNQVRAIGVSRAKDSISRLRFEYSLLLEFLEKKSETLGFPDLKSFTPSDIDADSIESLSLEDITKLLSTTPLAISKIQNLLPNALGDLIAERHQQYINSSSATEAAPATNGRTRRKRGVANGSTASARKRIRDPREPKRPTNAYLFFCDSERDRVKAEWAENHPNEHIDLSRAMTDVWRKMSNDDKKPYFEMYEKDKERYHKAVEEFANIKEQERLAATQVTTGASVEPEVETPASVTTITESTPVEAGPEDDADISMQEPENAGVTYDEHRPEEPHGEDEAEGEAEEENQELDVSKASLVHENGHIGNGDRLATHTLTDNEDNLNSELHEEEEEAEDEEEEAGEGEGDGEEEEEEEDDEEEEEEEDEDDEGDDDEGGEAEDDDADIAHVEKDDDDIAHSTDATDGIQDDDDVVEAPLLKSEPDDLSFNDGSEL